MSDDAAAGAGALELGADSVLHGSGLLPRTRRRVASWQVSPSGRSSVAEVLRQRGEAVLLRGSGPALVGGWATGEAALVRRRFSGLFSLPGVEREARRFGLGPFAAPETSRHIEAERDRVRSRLGVAAKGERDRALVGEQAASASRSKRSWPSVAASASLGARRSGVHSRSRFCTVELCATL